MKALKYLIIALVVLVVVFVAGAVVLVTTFDPNDYKETAITYVKENYGRDLRLDGDIGFTFFPALGVKLGEAELSNAPGFGEEAFARVEKVSVSVDLLSLLKAKVAADTVVLKGLRVNLQKNKNGQTNWDDLAKSSSASNEATTSDGSSASVGVEIAGLKITDSQIVFDDQQTGNKITLNPIEVQTGSIGSGKPSNISMQLGMAQTNPVMSADIGIESEAKLNVSTLVFQFSDLVLDVQAKGADLPNGEIGLNIKTNLDADINAESLKLTPVVIKLDDLELDGDLSVQSFSQPRISFSLHADEIDVDKLLPASEGASEETAASAGSTDDKIELPTDALRSLNLDGSLNVGTLRAAGLTMTDLTASIHAKGGKLDLNPLTMNLYEGSYTGSAGLNVSGNTPTYSASSDLKDLAVAGLLADLAEDGKSIIRGETTAAFKVTTRGDRVSSLKKQLNGTASFEAKDGALQSENLARNVERVVAFLKGREPKPAGEELVFDSLSGTANIQNGVAKNNDLKLDTPLILADGQGDIDVGNEAIDYRLAIGLSDEPDRASIPLTIKGPFEGPKFGVDFNAALSSKQKEIVNEKKEELKEKIDEKVKDKVGDKLKDLKLF